MRTPVVSALLFCFVSASAWAQSQPQAASTTPYVQPVCEAPVDQAAADYCIQVRVAESAERQTQLASWATNLSLIESGLLLLTVILTFLATRAAMRSAQIAEAAARDADKTIALAAQSAESSKTSALASVKLAESAERSLRPYVVTKQVLCTALQDDAGKVVGIRMGFQWTNTGVTAATNVKTHVHFNIISDPESVTDAMVDENLSFAETDQPDRRSIIGAQQTVTRESSIILTPPMLDAMWRGRSRPFLSSVVDYAEGTAQGRRYETAVCYEIRLNYEPEKMRPDYELLRFTSHWKFNRAS